MINRARHTASMHIPAHTPPGPCLTHSTCSVPDSWQQPCTFTSFLSGSRLHKERHPARDTARLAAIFPRKLLTDPQPPLFSHLISNATKRTEGGREDPAAHTLHAVSATFFFLITVYSIWMFFSFLDDAPEQRMTCYNYMEEGEEGVDAAAG